MVRGGGGGADEAEGRKWKSWQLHGCERRNGAPHVGVCSFSLLRLLSGAAVTWAPNKPHNET